MNLSGSQDDSTYEINPKLTSLTRLDHVQASRIAEGFSKRLIWLDIFFEVGREGALCYLRRQILICPRCLRLADGPQRLILSIL